MLTRNPASKQQTRALTFCMGKVKPVHFQKLFTTIFYFLQKPQDKDSPIGPTKNVMCPEGHQEAYLLHLILNNKVEHVFLQLQGGISLACGAARACWETKGLSFPKKVVKRPIYWGFIWAWLIIKSQIYLRKMETKSSCVICLSELASLLQEIEEAAFSKCTVRLTIKKLNLEIKDLDAEEISALACRIEERARLNQAKGVYESGKGNWVFEEQKLFCSILPYFCLLRRVTIDQMIHQDLKPLEAIFIDKSSTLLFFEWKYLDSLTNCFRVEWTEEDVKNLKDLMRDYKESSSQQEGIVRWKRISLELLELSGCTKFHSPRDCRQLWINHINPYVSKGSWDAAEDLELFLKIREYGNKWALISKLMKGVRTEHMIKNRVNSFMKKMKIRAKAFKPAQLDAIIDDLERKVAHQDFHSQKIEPEECLVKIEEEPQGEILTTLDYDRPNVKSQEYAVLYDVLDLTTDRIFVTQTDMPDSYQYSEDYSYIRPVEQDPIFEDLLNIEPNFYFYE